MNREKILKAVIWAGLISICFVPLILKEGFYFPFIVPRTIFFRAVVEIIFLAYLLLAIFKKEYRPKFNLTIVLFSLYIVSVSVSSILAKSFYFSFWGNNERSEGILLLLHLLAFLIVLSGFLKKFKEWLIIFDGVFLSGFLVAIYALGQQFGIKGFLGSSGGTRLTATIGNAAYVAGFLIFTILFGLLLFFYREKKLLRWYYAIGMALQSFVMFETLTRGAMISFAFSVVAFIGYLVFVRSRSSKVVRQTGIGVLLVAISFTGVLFLNKDAQWVKSNPILERVTTISVNAVTARNRLMTWESAYKGFKEKPILGYGYENFYQVFDKYFNPLIYRKAGSVIWFDRAHNIVADRVVTGGLVGLLLYLSAIFLPLIWLWKNGIEREQRDKYLLPAILSIIIFSFFIQHCFIFEALVTYMPLFVVMAFISRFSPTFGDKIFQSSRPYTIGSAVAVILIVPVMLSANVKWAVTNTDFIKALSQSNTQDYKEGYNNMMDVLKRETPGNQEYRQHIAEVIMSGIGLSQIDQTWLAQAIFEVEKEMDKQVEEKPLSARNYLMAARFFDRTYQFDLNRLSKALRLCEEAAEISPTRPQIFYEMSYVKIYLAQQYAAQGDMDNANKMMSESVKDMETALEIQPMVLESYVNVIMVLLLANEGDQVQGYLDRMDELGVNYHSEEQLARMANSAIHAANYQWTANFYEEATKIRPDNPNNWINLALAYAYLNRDEEAIAAAEKAVEFGGDAKQSELFIQNVKDNYFGN